MWTTTLLNFVYLATLGMFLQSTPDIIDFCQNRINPELDKEFCTDWMTGCYHYHVREDVEESEAFSFCSDYYEE